MAPSTEQTDLLLEWQPGPPEAATTNVLAALFRGARRANGCKALILALWLVYALVALGGADALLDVLRADSGPAEAAETLVQRGGGAAFLQRSWPRAVYGAMFLESITRRLWTPSPWFLLFYGLLAGAAIPYLHAPRPAPLLAQWGAAAGSWSGRFLRVLALNGCCFWLVVGGVGLLPARMTTGMNGFGGTVLLGALLATLLLLSAVLDYVRVRMVARDSRSVLLEAARTARFFVRHLPRMLALEALLLLLTGALAALVLALTGLLETLLPAGIAAFAGTQILIVALLWVRLTAWGAMLALYQGLALQRLSRAGGS